MPPRRRKKLKVAVRRTRVAYQWRSFAESARLWVQRGAFVGSAVVLAWGAHWAWAKTSLMAIAEVNVEGPSLPGWAEAPPIKPGQPLFSFSARRLEKRLLERYPQVEAVRVSRGLDRVVTVRLDLRKAVFRVPFGDRWKALDSQGVLFPLENPGTDLPVLVLPAGESPARTALAFLAALRAAKESWTDGLCKITMSSDGEVVLLLPGDVPVYWGEATPNPALVAAKARRLQRVLSAPEAAGGVVYARFVDDRRVVIKPRLERAERKGAHG